MWVHQKYGISLVVSKLYSVESNDCTYLAVNENVGMNWANNKNYDPQCTNVK